MSINNSSKMSKPDKIKIALVDDHTLLRDALSVYTYSVR